MSSHIRDKETPDVSTPSSNNVQTSLAEKEDIFPANDFSEGREGRKTNQLEYLRHVVMKALWKHPDSRMFKSPVDIIDLGIPDNLKVITHPICLGCIKTRYRNETCDIYFSLISITLYNVSFHLIENVDFIFSSHRLEQKHYWSAKECIEDLNLVFERYFANKKIERGIKPTEESLEKLFRKKVALMPKREVIYDRRL